MSTPGPSMTKRLCIAAGIGLWIEECTQYGASLGYLIFLVRVWPCMRLAQVHHIIWLFLFHFCYCFRFYSCVLFSSCPSMYVIISILQVHLMMCTMRKQLHKQYQQYRSTGQTHTHKHTYTETHAQPSTFGENCKNNWLCNHWTTYTNSHKK